MSRDLNNNLCVLTIFGNIYKKKESFDSFFNNKYIKNAFLFLSLMIFGKPAAIRLYKIATKQDNTL